MPRPLDELPMPNTTGIPWPPGGMCMPNTTGSLWPPGEVFMPDTTGSPWPPVTHVTRVDMRLRGLYSSSCFYMFLRPAAIG